MGTTHNHFFLSIGDIWPLQIEGELDVLGFVVPFTSTKPTLDQKLWK